MMNKEYIMSLKGKELTNLVAEKVLGWTNKELDNGFGYPANFWVNKLDERQYPVNFFSPSSRIEDAWRVFETVSSRGTLLSIQSPMNKFYMVTINYHEPIYVTGDTAPEAICKAALISVSGMEDGGSD